MVYMHIANRNLIDYLQNGSQEDVLNKQFYDLAKYVNSDGIVEVIGCEPYYLEKAIEKHSLTKPIIEQIPGLGLRVVGFS